MVWTLSAVAQSPICGRRFGGGAQIGSDTGTLFTALPVALTVNNMSGANSWQAAAIEVSPTDVTWNLIVRVICATVAG